MNGMVQLTLSDGTTYISTVSQEQGYAGFVSNGENITSLSIIGFGEYAPEVTALNSFTIATIPAPASLTGLLLLGGTGRSRRR